MANSVLRVAAAQYLVEPLASSDELRQKLEAWVAAAVEQGARLLVFPEYSGMELASLSNRRQTATRRSPDRHALGPLAVAAPRRSEQPSLAWETSAVQERLPEFLAIHSALAAAYGVYILAGSVPVTAGNVTRNRAYFFDAKGKLGFQDKIVPTRWESDHWGISGGDRINVFDTDFGQIGIAICYDVEFPMVTRLQSEAGARLLLSPCCCDSARGYYRVRVGAAARALENQAYTIQACTVGESAWSGAIGEAIGRAGVFSPPDLGPNVNGVIAESSGPEPQWTYADLDMDALDRLRLGKNIIANRDQWDAHLKFRHALHAEFSQEQASSPAAGEDASGDNERVKTAHFAQ